MKRVVIFDINLGIVARIIEIEDNVEHHICSKKVVRRKHNREQLLKELEGLLYVIKEA